MIVIKLNILKTVGKNPGAVKIAAVSALALTVVPISIFGYATNENDYVETASTIVEVESITDEKANIDIEPTTVVDENIANILGITTENGVINDNIDSIISNVDKVQLGINAETKKLIADAKEEKEKQREAEEATSVETKAVDEPEVTTSQAVEVVETTQPEVLTEEVYVPEYIVFKPSTHYVHRSTCRWADSSCYEITTTEDIEARLCTECNADIEIINEYVVPTPVVDNSSASASASGAIDAYSRQLLAEIVWHEAGSNWISQYNKAKIAAGVMNRVNDPRFPNTVYAVLTQPYQFSGYWPGSCTPSQACYDAVDYYFSHISEFNWDNSWYGDGYQNHFYHQ